MSVSIVIPNYKGRQILPKTLAHLFETVSADEVEVVLVDDASEDGSVEFVRKNYPQVRLLALEENLGFSGACNAGGRAAGGDFIYFMNSDVYPHQGFLDSLVNALSNDALLFSAQSLNLNPQGAVVPPNQVTPSIQRGQIRVRGLSLDPLWKAGHLGGYGLVPTLYGAGGSVLVRGSHFEELGGFSEAFRPYYYEDTDLGWRAWRRGWKSVLDPASVVVHDHDHGSIASTQKKRAVQSHRKRNRFLLLWRNYIDDEAFRKEHLFKLPVHLAGKVLSADRAALRGFWSAFRERDRVREHRKEEKRAQKIADRDIFAELESARSRLREFAASKGCAIR